jgi:hypothetical protein
MSDTAPDAVTLLKEDHRAVEGLFKEYEDATGAAKRKLAERIARR